MRVLPSKRIAFTGRVLSFLGNPRGRLPVSCTVYVVKDYQSYLESLKFTSYALRFGAGVSLHIGELDLSDFPTKFPNVYFYLSKSHPEYEEFSQLENFTDTHIGEVIKVYDSMVESIPDTVSIEDSWLKVFSFESGKDYTIDLSLLRPKGTTNSYGLTASGAVSFAGIYVKLLEVLKQEKKIVAIMGAYSKLNEILRRGGLYKNGAIVIHCDVDSPNVWEFLSASREDCPWVRVSLNLNQEKDKNPPEVVKAAIPSVRSGDLFLVKKVYQNGQRLYHNVCLEVLLPHRGTCLLSHVNLGVTPKSKIPQAFVDAAKFLCDLHPKTQVDKHGFYLPPEQDKQIGIGVLGLANLLAFYKVKYKEFVEALKDVLDGRSKDSEAHKIAEYLYEGYMAAARIAVSHNMERAFVIAPTANCSFKYKDFRGYTTTPEISPPVARSVVRISETTEEIQVEYPPDCEIASEVGWDTYFELINQWQRLMNATGLAHAISANWWSDVVVMNEQFIDKWLDSNLRSLYYALPVLGEIPECDLLEGCTACAE